MVAVAVVIVVVASVACVVVVVEDEGAVVVVVVVGSEVALHPSVNPLVMIVDDIQEVEDENEKEDGDKTEV